MSGCHIENISKLGFFGKLPINGDFIQRDLPAHFIHLWDSWLQENLSACQQQLAESWLKHYLTSPIWRFFIAPSVIDNNAYIGIVGPSVDSVGRYFPLTIATPIAVEHVPSLFSAAFQDIYSELENLFLKYLNADSSTGSISIESLSKELLQHSASMQQLIKTQSLDRLPESLDSHRFILSDQSDISGAISSLWLMQIMEQHNGASLWWSNGSHAFEPSLLINRGLPNKQQFISMLTGFNNKNHWRQKQLSIALMEKAPPETPCIANIETENPKPQKHLTLNKYFQMPTRRHKILLVQTIRNFQKVLMTLLANNCWMIFSKTHQLIQMSIQLVLILQTHLFSNKSIPVLVRSATKESKTRMLSFSIKASLCGSLPMAWVAIHREIKRVKP